MCYKMHKDSIIAHCEHISIAIEDYVEALRQDGQSIEGAYFYINENVCMVRDVTVVEVSLYLSIAICRVTSSPPSSR